MKVRYNKGMGCPWKVYGGLHRPMEQPNLQRIGKALIKGQCGETH